MDKGSSAYTSYEFTEDVAGFIMEKIMSGEPNWANPKIGHIHSHNTMGVFFSGTDKDELHDNVANHNFYVSLIVNNFMDMTAKIAFVGKRPPILVEQKYTSLNENGEIYEFVLGEATELTFNDVMFIHDCKVIKPQEEIVVEDTFRARLDFILEEAKKKEQEAAAKRKVDSRYVAPSEAEKQRKAGQGLNSYPPSHNNYPSSTTKLLEKVKEVNINGRKPFDADDSWDGGSLFSGIVGKDGEDVTTLDEDFVCYILRKGERHSNDNIEKCLEEVAMEQQPIDTLTDHIIDNFGGYYSSFFNDLSTVTMEDFLETVESCVLELETFEGKSTIAAKLIQKLKSYGTVLSEKWKDEVLGKGAKENVGQI